MLESFLRERYLVTKWPYFSMLEVLYLTRSTKNDLNELRLRNMIEKASGMNGTLIKIVNWEEKWLS